MSHAEVATRRTHIRNRSPGPLRPVFWRQVGAFTAANMKTRYRNTFAGFLWVVLNPLIMFGAQSFAFKHVLNIKVPNYSIFLLSALLPWIFIQQSLEMCTSLFVVSGRLLKAFPVHPLAFLLAQVADNSVNFLAAFALILVPLWISSPAHAIGLLALLPAAAVLVTGVLGLCWLAATLQVFYRDVRFIVSFGLSIAFFLTPIFYPAEFVPARYLPLVALNPFHRLIQPFRVALGDFSPGAYFSALGLAALVAGFFLLVAAAVWRSKRNAVYLNV